MKFNRSIALLFATFIAAANATWIETGAEIESRPGVKTMYVVSAEKSITDRNAVKNMVLLLTGGAGVIPPAVNGIKEQKPDRVALRGFMAEKLGVLVAVGLPSDQAQGISPEWRDTEEHAKDVSAVMDVLMMQYPAARITVLGFSNGCRSAAHIAAAARKRWGTSLQGVAMLSCAGSAFREDRMAALDGPRSGANALPKVPVLVVHHKRDSCLRIENVEPLAKVYDFIAVEDTKQPRPNIMRPDCSRGSAHEFGGKGALVYQAVVDWINTGKTADLK